VFLTDQSVAAPARRPRTIIKTPAPPFQARHYDPNRNRGWRRPGSGPGLTSRPDSHWLSVHNPVADTVFQGLATICGKNANGCFRKPSTSGTPMLPARFWNNALGGVAPLLALTILPLAVRRPHRGRLQPRQCRPHRLRERARFGCALLQNAAQSDGDSEVAILPLMSAPARRQLWLIPLPGEQVLSAHVPRTRWSRPSTRSEPKSPSSGSRSDPGSARGSSGSWQSTTTKRGFPGPRQPLINDAIKNYSAFAAFKAEGINQPSL